jgi:hypothetical protein
MSIVSNDFGPEAGPLSWLGPARAEVAPLVRTRRLRAVGMHESEEQTAARRMAAGILENIGTTPPDQTCGAFFVTESPVHDEAHRIMCNQLGLSGPSQADVLTVTAMGRNLSVTRTALGAVNNRGEDVSGPPHVQYEFRVDSLQSLRPRLP